MAVQLNNVYNSNAPSWKLKVEVQSKLLNSTKQTKPSLFRVYAAAASTNARQLIESGAIKAITPKDAATAIGSEGFVLLDIRPIWEREKARVTGSLHVPLFVEDEDNSPITLIKKWVHFGYIGLWTGQNFTTLNPDFINQVVDVVPEKDTKLLVACGEGLRSEIFIYIQNRVLISSFGLLFIKWF